MMKKLIRKLIRISRIGTIKRIIKYRKLTSFLGLKNAHITNVDQIEFDGCNIISTGNDSKIFIRTNRFINQINFKTTISNSNKIEIYYSPYDKKSADFTPNDRVIINRSKNNEIKRNIILGKKSRFFRVDLTDETGIIDMNGFQMDFQKKSKNEFEYKSELEMINTKNNKKIVIITHGLDNTGAPILAFNISKELKNKGYEVFVISLSDGRLGNDYLDNDINIISLHQDSLSKKIIDSEKLEKVIKELKNKGFSNVLTNTIISGICAPLFKKHNFKVVSLIHEMGNSIETYDMKQGGRDISMYSDLIVFPDKIVKDEFIDIFGEDNAKSIICTQGVYKPKLSIDVNKKEVCKKLEIPENSILVVGSGTADYRKGIDLFLQAAVKLVQYEKKNEYHFIWAGNLADKNIESWYNLEFKKMGYENRFHNINFISDKKEYQNLISSSDVFWLTSREDPFPSVMIESLEYGTPVVAFKNTGGANTMLSDGRGILIDNFDPEQLAKKTYELLSSSKKEINDMISKAQSFINKKLNFKDYIESLEKMFNENKKEIKYADLSVVIPNYNYEDFLPVRINSILNQTIKPREIILLDDVSIDNSIEVSKKVLELGKKKYGIDYKIIKNETNNGCFNQWLKGLNEAKYDYVWIAEADDYAQPNFIEELYPKIKNKGVSIAYCKSKVINEYCEVVDYEYTSYTDDLDLNKWNSDFVEDGVNQVKEYFSKKNIIPNVSSSIINKSMISGIENELSKYQIIGDWLAYIYILLHGKVAYSSKALNGHRRHSKSIIARKEKTPEFFDELIRIKKYILDNVSLNDSQLNEMMLSFQNANTLFEIDSNNPKLSQSYSELISEIQKKKVKENILIIIPDLSVGGGQSVAIRLANNLTKMYNVFLVNARDYIVTDFMKNMIDKNVTVLDKSDPDSLRCYYKLIGFKSCISFIWWSDKLAYMAFKDEDINLITSQHGCYEMLLHNPDVDEYFNNNSKHMLNRFNHIIYTAEKNKEIYYKYEIENNPKITKIDNGFILGDYPKKDRKELGLSKDDFIFCLVARGIPEKGYEEAIQALKIVNKTATKKAHLLLVGSSDYLTSLNSKYGDIDELHFINEFSLPSEWIGYEEISDVGLLPSYFKSESLPTVIVEFLFLNKPVIATDIAEIKSMLINEKAEAGRLINLKDGKADIKQLADKMKELMDDKRVYKELKEGTKELSNRFDMEKCIELYSELIEEE